MQTKQNIFTRNITVIIMACICTALWGSATPAIKNSYILFDIQQNDIASKIFLAGIRFTLAGIMVITVVSFMQKKICLLPKKSVPKVVLLGIIQTALQYLFFYIGLGYTTGANGSLFSSVNAFIVVLLSPFIFKSEKFTLWKIAGCVLGFAGLMFACSTSGALFSNFTFKGEGCVILGSASLAAGFFYSKHISKTTDPKAASGWNLLFGGILLTITGLLLGGRLQYTGSAAILLLVYLSLLSAIAFTLWAILLKYNSVSKISIFSLLTPLFGSLFSGIFLGENVLKLNNMLALICVCAGIAFVNNSKTTPARSISRSA